MFSRIIDTLLRAIGRIGFLRFGVKDRLARAWNPPGGEREPFCVDFYGLKYSGDKSSFIDWSVYYFGAYSSAELALFDDLANLCPRPVVLDVGGNVGHHGLYYSRLAGQVIAFEPFPSVADIYQKRIDENCIQNLRLLTIGLSERDAELSFFAPDNCNAGIGTFVPVGGRSEIKLKVRKGDDVLKELAVKHVDFIKIDVEGFEPEVLVGLSSTIRRDQPVIFVEWSQAAREKATGIKEVIPEGYRCFDFVVRLPVLGIFQFMPYKLVPFTSADGNKVLVPESKSALLSGLTRT